MKTTDNMQEKQQAYMFVANCTEVGNKVFCCLPVDMLKIDHDMYQRPLQRSFKHIVENWDADKCDPLTVNYRGNGYFYIIDGQHRYEAAKTKGVTQLVCNIFVGLSLQKEAELFACQYDGTTKLSPIDSYRANIIRKDPVDMQLKAILDKYGVSVSYNKKDPKVLCALSCARRVLQPGKLPNGKKLTIKQNAEILDWAFSVIKDSGWDVYPGVYCYNIVNGLCQVRRLHNDTFAVVKHILVRNFQQIIPQQMNALGNWYFSSESTSAAVGAVMEEIANKNIEISGKVVTQYKRGNDGKIQENIYNIA